MASTKVKVRKGRRKHEEDFDFQENITPPGPNLHHFTYQGKPPQYFSFVDTEWESWLRTFERYRSASMLGLEPEEAQVNTLILTMGPKAESILDTFNLTLVDQNSYDLVVERFCKYFAKKTNIIYERAKFNNRCQESNESVSDFITDLFQLSQTCKYGLLRDELVRDRIVVGIKDSKLSLSLQMDASLTLESVIDKVKQSESIKTQQTFVRKDSDVEDKFSALVVSKSKQFRCYRCGSVKPHKKDECQARGATCFKCKRIGHYSNCCKRNFPKDLQEMSNELSNDKDEFQPGKCSTVETVSLCEVIVYNI